MANFGWMFEQDQILAHLKTTLHQQSIPTRLHLKSELLTSYVLGSGWLLDFGPFQRPLGIWHPPNILFQWRWMRHVDEARQGRKPSVLRLRSFGKGVQ